MTSRLSGSAEGTEMKIAMIAPPWLPVPPPAYGGTESVIDRLARGLADAGHDVLLVTTGDSTCPVARAWTIEEAATDAMGNVAVELRHVIGAAGAISDADVVHDHTLVGPILAAERGDRRVVTTCHGSFDQTLTPLYRHISEQVEVIAISHDQASRARDVRIAAVIHHGIEPERFPVGSGDGDYLLFLGRLSPDKGAHIAARVAREVGMPLVLAAKCREAAEHEYFEHQLAPLLGGNIEYVGEVCGTEKLGLLGGARALLNPIAWPEPFGLVMIEALACGTPVVATRHGSVPEIVDHGLTGFVVDSCDDLAPFLERIDTLDRVACRAAVESRFSMAQMVAAHETLYTRVASGSSHTLQGPNKNTTATYDERPPRLAAAAVA